MVTQNLEAEVRQTPKAQSISIWTLQGRHQTVTVMAQILV